MKANPVTRQSFWSLSLFLAGLAVGCQESVAPADRVAELEGEPIPYSDFEAFLARNSVDGVAVLGSDVLSSLLDQFLDERLLCSLARDRLELHEIADGRAAAAALLQEVEEQPDQGAVALHYRQNQARFEYPQRVHLRQLLFANRDQAERIREQWVGGAAYEEIVAVADSLDTAHVGEEGVFGRADLPPAFVDLLFGLAEGEVSEVMVADYGVHVFQVVQHLPAGIAPLSEVASEIRAELVDRNRQRALAQLVDEARERYNVRVFERNVPFNYQGEFDSNVQNESP